MTECPATRPSLLFRLRDRRDAQAWGQFVDLYAPLVYGFVRKQGLQDADAADLTQDVLLSVAGAVHRLEYDPARGRFRGWLFTVVRNRLRNHFARSHPAGQGSGDSAVQQALDAVPAREEDSSALWERDCDRRLFAWAVEQVRGQFRPATWQAFWQTAVEGKSGQEAAASLGLSVSAVYLAKSRVLARLKEQVRLADDDELIFPGGS